jgi:hypothetical protein
LFNPARLAAGLIPEQKFTIASEISPMRGKSAGDFIWNYCHF